MFALLLSSCPDLLSLSLFLFLFLSLSLARSLTLTHSQRHTRLSILTAKDTTTAPNPDNRASHTIGTVGGHGGLHDLERLAQRRHLEQVQTRAQQQVAELDRLLLELLATRRRRDCRRHAVREGVLVLRAGPRRQCGFFAWGCGLGMEWSGVGGKRVLGRGSVSENERVSERCAGRRSMSSALSDLSFPQAQLILAKETRREDR